MAVFFHHSSSPMNFKTVFVIMQGLRPTIACLSLEMAVCYAVEDHTTIIWPFLSPLRTSWEAASSKGASCSTSVDISSHLRLAAQQSQKNVKPP